MTYFEPICDWSSRRRPSLGVLSCSSSALGSRRHPSLGVLSCLVVRFGGAGGLKPRSLTQKATWEFPSCLLEIPQGPLVADVAASAWAWSCRDCPVLPTLLVKPGSYLSSLTFSSRHADGVGLTRQSRSRSSGINNQNYKHYVKTARWSTGRAQSEAITRARSAASASEASSEA